MLRFMCFIATTAQTDQKEQAASMAYLLLWTIGLLLAFLVIAAVLLISRRNRRAVRHKQADESPDPWDESAKRLAVEEPLGRGGPRIVEDANGIDDSEDIDDLDDLRDRRN